MSRPRFIALLLALVTLVVYLPAGQNDFLVYDDDDYVVANPMVRSGWTVAGIKQAFFSSQVSNWHPITWLSHMTDCELFGLNARAHHLVNVLFHSANTALLFVWLWRFTKKIWPAALVAALFAWHPLHVESVAWVSERKDVLSTFFALLALLSYGKFAELDQTRDARARYFLMGSLMAFALGLMAKPMLVTLPCVLLLLDYWPLQRFTLGTFRWALVREKAPFLLLSLASCLVTLWAQQAAVATLKKVPLVFRAENAVAATLRYLMKMFWPIDLAVIYPLARIPVTTLLAAVAVLAAVSCIAWRGRETKPYFLVGWLWFLGTLVPVIGLVHVGSAAMADRYTYLPAIGIFMVLAYGLHELAGAFPRAGKVFPVGAALLLGSCVLLTEKQLGYWRDSETLFRHTIAVTQDNDVAHVHLGLALERAGRAEAALKEYRTALQLNPFHYQLRFAIGKMLEKTGQPAAALAEYQLCLQRDPKIPALHQAAGSALAALGQSEAALAAFAEAARLDAHFAAPHVGKAKIFFAQGRDAEAVQAVWAATQAEPYSYEILSTAAHYLAANENPAARDGQSALVLAAKANELSDSREPAVLDVLGMALAENGDFTNAVACARQALEMADVTSAPAPGAIQARLGLYEKRQPWRESFRVTPR